MRPVKQDEFFMQRALVLAQQGAGAVHPNPLVGAVLVKKAKIIAEGAHKRFGGPHAEIAALKKTSQARGATLYVTLEPCCHFGKTPPCLDQILESKIKKIVIGMKDPNPQVGGKSIRALKKAGIQVSVGVLKDKCHQINRDFVCWIKRKRPYVVIKAAQSLDGKIATRTGDSRWITGPEARVFSHELRASSDAVLVGINTILKDNPRLNVRTIQKKNSSLLKIVLDTKLQTPLKSRIFSVNSPGSVLIATTKKAPAKKRSLIQKKAQVLVCQSHQGRISLKPLLKELARKGVVRLLVEGGGEVIADFLNHRLVDEVYWFTAPVIIGGKRAVPSVGGEGAKFLKQAVHLKKMQAALLGKDFLIHGVL